MKKFLKIVGFVFLGLIVLGVFANMGEDSATNEPVEEVVADAPKEEKKAEPKKEAKKEEPKLIPLGEAADLNGIRVTVNGTERASAVGDEFGKLEASGEFYMVTVTIKNENKEAIVTDEGYFTLKLEDGTVFQPSADAFMYQDESMIYEEINPGLEKTGTIVFDVPAGTEGFTLQANEGFWGTNSVDMEVE
jgi:Domain of unknown function (DUF4352)